MAGDDVVGIAGTKRTTGVRPVTLPLTPIFNSGAPGGSGGSGGGAGMTTNTATEYGVSEEYMRANGIDPAQVQSYGHHMSGNDIQSTTFTMKDGSSRELGREYSTDELASIFDGSVNTGGAQGIIGQGGASITTQYTPGGTYHAPAGTPGVGGGSGDGSSGGSGSGGIGNQNALAGLKGVLDQYGLGSLGDWAYDLLVKGYNSDYILQELRNRPEFKTRFPAIEARQKAGLSPLSPADYIKMEGQYDEILHQSGLSGLVDRQSLYTKWLSGDVSASEVKSRADLAYQAAMGEPLSIRTELQRLYGPSAGSVATAMFLDPDTSLPKAQKMLHAGELAGASSMSGYGLLTKDEAESLADMGISFQQGQQGFGQLNTNKELFAPLPGEGGASVTRDQQLAAAFGGNTTDQQMIERRARERVGAFQGSAGFGVNQRGVSGLGSTSS